jgi:hypothetical protein
MSKAEPGYPRKRIPLAKAANALAYSDLGYPNNQIAQLANISETSVREILNQHGRWGVNLKGVDRAVLARLRQEQNAVLEQAWRTGAAQAMARAFTPDKMEKASFLQLTTGACQAIDKSLLLSGAPTQIVGHIEDRRSIESLEALATALSQMVTGHEVGATMGASVDVTPTKPE